ncbi:hypothetical protein M3Y97_00333200 [Aphelenchoides bicaudatus]|nr:hypothetical protein M3Y97_00333200 [Aphelenchoides bicaudatus]
MPPQLIPCPFCDRLYTHFSIDLHQPNCLSNPDRRVKLPQLKRSAHTSIGPPNSSTRRPLPALSERRSRSVGSNSVNSSSNGSTESPNTSDENRPSTRNINKNRRPKSRTNRQKRQRTPKRREVSPPRDPDKRICFVCGEKVPMDDLLDHEIECEAEWRTQRREFPTTIRVRSPRAMRIPSVDGTIDVNRIDFYASESAERANKTRCLRCCRHVPFAHVLQHQCTRFEPTVQFYF